MKAILKREANAYFDSMTGYIFIAFLVAAVGIYFYLINLYGGYPYFGTTLNSTLYIFMVAIPVLTMRSFAEEKRSKTDQLLLTSPVSATGIVMGKYLAMLYVYVFPVLLFCLCPVLIGLTGTAYYAADYATIFTFFLMGALYISIGMFISSLCDSQMIAFVSTFVVLLVLYLWDTIVSFIPASSVASFIGILIISLLIAFFVYRMSKNWVASCITGFVLMLIASAVFAIDSALFENLLPSVLKSFSVIGVMNNVAVYNVLDLRGIAMFLTMTVLMIFLTVQMLQKRRWS